MKTISSNIINNIAFIIFQDDETNNSISTKKILSIIKLLDKFSKDKRVDIIVFKSSVKNYFLSGYNYNELNNLNESDSKIFASTGQRLIKKIKELKKIVVSCIDGYSLGAGFEITLASDIILATKDSKFGFPEVNQGIIPGFGGTQLFTRKIYETFVKYLVFTGDNVSALELENKGIITRTFESNKEMDFFIESFAEKISNKSTFAIGLAKETINAGLEVDLNTALLLEQNAFTVAFSSNDKKEGMTAFIEKRRPEFTDRWEDFEDL